MPSRESTLRRLGGGSSSDPTEEEKLQDLRERVARKAADIRSTTGNRISEEEALKYAEGNDSSGGFSFLGDAVSGVADVAGNALGRTLDVLQRGQYTVAAPFVRASRKEGLGAILTSPFAGAAGKEKASFGQVFENLGVDNTATDVLGFGLDIGLDPLTYFGVGLAGKAGKAGKAAAAAARGLTKADDVADAAKAVDKVSDITKATSFIDDSSRVTGKVGRVGLTEVRGQGAALRKDAFDEFVSGKFSPKAFNSMADRNAHRLARLDGKTWNKLPQAEKTAFRQQAREEIMAQLEREWIGRSDDAINAAKRTLELRLQSPLGRKVYATRQLRSLDKVTDAGRAVGRRLTDTDTGLGRLGNRVHQAFSTNASYGSGVATLRAIHRARAASDFDNVFGTFRKRWRDSGWEKFTPAEQTAIAESLDTGTRLADAKLQEAADYVKGVLNDIRVWEEETGFLRPALVDSKTGKILDEGTILDNYFPHYYAKKIDPNTRNKIRSLRRQRNVGKPPTSTQTRVFESFAEARAKDFEPITDIVEVMNRRIADHVTTMERYDFLGDMIENFGVTVKGKTRLASSQRKMLKGRDYESLTDLLTVGGGRGKGYESLHKYIGDLADDGDVFFDPEVKEALRMMDQLWVQDDVAADFLNYYQKAHSKVKFGLTVANPGFHIRNMRGDIALNFLDGVRSPRLYGKAVRMLKASPEDLANMTFKINDDLTLRGDEVMRFFAESGSKSGFIKQELGQQVYKGRVEKLRGQATDFLRAGSEKARNVSEFREDIPRLTHFMDVLRREGAGISDVSTQAWHDVVMEGGKRVRKFNFDYSDLTRQEQRLKHVFPFYTWFRKNTPLQLEMLFTRPGVQAMYAKATGNFAEQVWGTPDGETAVPHWLKESGAIQVRGAKNPNAIGRFLQGFDQLPTPVRAVASGFVPGTGAASIPGDDPVFWNPGNSLPLFDALSQLDAPVKAVGAGLAAGNDPRDAIPAAINAGSETFFKDIVLGQLSPMLKGPGEIGTGRNFFTGQETDATSYLSQLFPWQKVASNIGNTEPNAVEKVINTLYAADTYTATPVRQRGELRRQEDRIDIVRRQLGLIGQ